MPPLDHVLADTLNYLLAGLLLPAPFVGRRGKPPVEFWARSFASIGVAVILAEEGKRLTHSGFPSGHETFALAVGTSLACRDPRWLWAAVPLCGALGWALVSAGYHAPVDIGGALLLAPPIALLCHRIKFPPNR